jgi:hypothetical protein
MECATLQLIGPPHNQRLVRNSKGAAMSHLQKLLAFVGTGIIALALCAPVEAGGWGRGPSWNQARKDAGNVAKAVHQAISSVRVQTGSGRGAGGSGMTAEGGDGRIHEDTDGGQLLNGLLPSIIPRDWTPPPSGPYMENARTPLFPPNCGMNCESPAETNPAMDLPEKPIEAPTPVAD